VTNVTNWDAGDPHVPAGFETWGQAISEDVDAAATGLAGKVGLTGDEAVAGVKTFSSSPIVPAPTTDLQAATKKYVDDAGGGDSFGGVQFGFINVGAGTWIPFLESGADSAVAHGGITGRIYFAPFVPRYTVTLDLLGFECSSSVAGSSARVGIYETGADGKPSSLVDQTAELATTSTGFKSGAVSASLTAGVNYWVAFSKSDTSIGLRTPGVGGMRLFASGTGSGVQNRVLTGYSETTAYAAMPASASVDGESRNVAVIPWLFGRTS